MKWSQKVAEKQREKNKESRGRKQIEKVECESSESKLKVSRVSGEKRDGVRKWSDEIERERREKLK